MRDARNLGTMLAVPLVGVAMGMVGSLAGGQPVTDYPHLMPDVELSPRLELIDEGGQKRVVEEADLKDLPRRKMEFPTDGGPTTYEGFSLADVLRHVGVGFGDQLKGRRTPTVVLCEAADGYRIVLALAEIDPATTDKVVLLADRCEDGALPAGEGPFRLVIPDEKRKVRSIRMLQRIRVVNLQDMPLTQQFEPPAEPSK